LGSGLSLTLNTTCPVARMPGGKLVWRILYMPGVNLTAGLTAVDGSWMSQRLVPSSRDSPGARFLGPQNS
jgi:hypothetical protein